jgi:hypothetical protein
VVMRVKGMMDYQQPLTMISPMWYQVTTTTTVPIVTMTVLTLEWIPEIGMKIHQLMMLVAAVRVERTTAMERTTVMGVTAIMGMLAVIRR